MRLTSLTVMPREIKSGMVKRLPAQNEPLASERLKVNFEPLRAGLVILFARVAVY